MDRYKTESIDWIDTKAETTDWIDTKTESIDWIDTTAETIDWIDTTAETIDWIDTKTESIDWIDTKSESFDWIDTKTESTDTDTERYIFGNYEYESSIGAIKFYNKRNYINSNRIIKHFFINFKFHNLKKNIESSCVLRFHVDKD